jgi:hypothetical protein
MSDETRLELALPLATIEAIARRSAEIAAEIVLERLNAEERSASESRWMTVPETASFLRCSRQHVYDLRSDRRLTPHVEGGRALCSREEVVVLVENR